MTIGNTPPCPGILKTWWPFWGTDPPPVTVYIRGPIKRVIYNHIKITIQLFLKGAVPNLDPNLGTSIGNPVWFRIPVPSLNPKPSVHNLWLRVQDIGLGVVRGSWIVILKLYP